MRKPRQRKLLHIAPIARTRARDKTPALKIFQAMGFDARAAARYFLRHGILAIDDISGNLHEISWEETLMELGHVADEIDIRSAEIDTAFGTVFVYRDAGVVSAAEARAAVLREHPAADADPG